MNRHRDLNSPSTESEPDTDPYRLEGIATTATVAPVAAAAVYEPSPVDQFNNVPAQTQTYNNGPVQTQTYNNVPAQTQATYVTPVTNAPSPLNQTPVGPLEQPQSFQRQNTNYGEWMIPAAAGAGAGALGAAAYAQHENPKTPVAEEPEHTYSNPNSGAFVAIPTTTNTLAHNNADVTSSPSSTRAVKDEPVASTPLVTASNALPTATVSAASAGAYNSNAGISGEATDLSGPINTSSEGSLGGLEAEGAHGTGQLFPAVVRHDTDMSVSKLHVPGEYVTTTPAAAPSQWDLVRE